MTSSDTSSSSSTSLMTWLRLMRLPTVFTALADILCGFLVSSAVGGGMSVGEVLAKPELWCLLAASAGLYLGGMVLNDVFDARLDAVERPERPIPSGRISVRTAAVFGASLLVTGVVFAWLSGHLAETGTGGLNVAVLLAIAVVAYDGLLKPTVLGPLGMGTCRFLNVLLGASASGVWPDHLKGPQFDVALALGVYITGVTFFARNEAGGASRVSMSLAMGLMLAGIAVDVRLVRTGDFPESVVTGTLIALGLVAANVVIRCSRAIRSLRPKLVQKTVGLLLLSIIFLDAAMVFCVTGDASLASLVVFLVVPATLMKRAIPLS
ncbi:MAG: UbiA family prenyltransferase [Planctomycetaceae bacterium]